MANKKFWLGMLVIALVFGMTVVDCDNGSTGGGSGGTITVEGIPPKYNGSYAGVRTFYYAVDEGFFINGAQNITTQATTLARISNGKVSMPMWLINENNIIKYSGNDTFGLDFLICDQAIYHNALQMAGFYFDSVTFSNGNAKLSWNDNVGVNEFDNVSGLSGTWVGNIGGKSITARANSQEFIVPSWKYRARFYRIDNNSITFSSYPNDFTGEILNGNTINITFPESIILPDNTTLPAGTYIFNKQ